MHKIIEYAAIWLLSGAISCFLWSICAMYWFSNSDKTNDDQMSSAFFTVFMEPLVFIIGGSLFLYVWTHTN